MLTSELVSATQIDDKSNVASHNHTFSLLNQKLIVNLKAEWSQEYIFWKSSIHEYDRISKSGSLRENHGKVKLSILNRKLKELLNREFADIEVEINELITNAHQPNFKNEEEEYADRYWNVQNDLQNFRKEARNIQIMILQHVNKHLPLFIF